MCVCVCMCTILRHNIGAAVIALFYFHFAITVVHIIFLQRKKINLLLISPKTPFFPLFILFYGIQNAYNSSVFYFTILLAIHACRII